MGKDDENNTTSSFLPQIPYPRNPFFTGRNDLLEEIADSFKIRRIAALTQPPLAICGLGGIGKTQIAVEYAYRHYNDYNIILWAQAEKQETLISSFVAIAKLLNLPQKNASNQEITVGAVKQWMSEHTGWLFIFDNSDDLKMVKEFIPPRPGGHILLTTRAQAMGRLAQRLEVGTMTPEAGALFLLRRTTLIPAEALLEQASITERGAALEISRELGGLPLALDQAGAYIEETSCGLLHYLSNYKEQRSVLLEQRGGLIDDHPEPVTTTWSISFEQARQINPTTADLLHLCAFLYPDMIPEEIISKGVRHLSPLLHNLSTDSRAFDDTIKTLRRYSLINRDMKNHALSIHRLIQVVLRGAMNSEMYRQWAERAVYAVNEVFPHVEVMTWPQCERCLSNARVCTELIKEVNMTTSEAAHLLNNTGWYLQERGRYIEAEVLLRQALTIREEQLGLEHPDTTTSMNNLALLITEQGKYAEAEPLYKKALAIQKKLLQSEHPLTAMTMNNLAWLCYIQGRYAEAEALYTQALEIQKQSQGSEHPNTATSMADLAWLYYIQGRYTEAKPLYRKALGIQKQRIGINHPATAKCQNNLALLYIAQGKYAEAEPLLLQALETRGRWFDSEHPSIAISLTNLARFCQTQRSYIDAEAYYKRALEIRRQRLGLQHPDTAMSMNNLGSLYCELGNYSDAESHIRRALVIQKQQLGTGHLETARSMMNLSQIYYAQGKYIKAEALLLRAQKIYEQRLGMKHPSMALIMTYLAMLYRAQGRYREAEPLLQRALEIYKQQVETGHCDRILALKEYGSLLRMTNREADAEVVEAQIPPI